MPALTKCYYEVLGVERNADDETIKKIYRKLALQLHPDKNPDRSEEAKVEFQYLQQAYAVLSNPQERAWYDEHRLAVLRGGLDAEFEDYNIDLIPFCSSACYKGFGDDEGGFYTVYREVFEKITAEEIEAGDEEDRIPGFGDSTSSYENIVGVFYSFWEGYCTRRTFAWIDEFDTREAENRRVARLMEKENKKIRSEARKDWNQRVRALVDFVKRKDKRVQAWKIESEALLKRKEEALAQRHNEEKARRRRERKQLLEQHKTKYAAVAEHHQSQLKEMEQWVSNEFGDGNSSEQSEEEEVTCLHCAACNKTFKSEKAFSNHEKSKKHFAQVELLRNTMESEDAQFGTGIEHDEDENGEWEDIEDNASIHSDNIHSDVEICEVENGTVSDNSNADEVDENSVDDLIDKLNTNMIINRKCGHNRKGSDPESDNDTPQKNEVDDSSSVQLQVDEASANKESVEESKTSVKKKRRADKSTKSVNAAPIAPTVPQEVNKAIDETCAVCRQTFNSRNQLFKHMKTSGHSVPINVANARLEFEEIDKSKAKKGKRKNK